MNVVLHVLSVLPLAFLCHRIVEHDKGERLAATAVDRTDVTQGLSGRDSAESIAERPKTSQSASMNELDQFESRKDDEDCDCCRDTWQRASGVTCLALYKAPGVCVTDNGYICPEGFRRILAQAECEEIMRDFHRAAPLLNGTSTTDPYGCYVVVGADGIVHPYWNTQGMTNTCNPPKFRNLVCRRKHEECCTEGCKASLLEARMQLSQKTQTRHPTDGCAC
eukprot:TRINITY_DN9221_c0_g1_i2.p1 TRINITY_DN9221_c0_g1~~TRINITY_DN9221_c0_g1_i2.p1  ORF type:complete len:222 (-),score=20.10 TRINITY_DN9221_c0_g1_i2:380-1045(-)